MDGSGIGISLGAGIAIGLAAGRKAACDAVRRYFQATHVTLQRAGTGLPIEDLLGEALKTELRSKKRLVVIATLVLGMLAFIGTALYTVRN